MNFLIKANLKKGLNQDVIKKFIIKIYRAIADFILNNSGGKPKWS